MFLRWIILLFIIKYSEAQQCLTAPSCPTVLSWSSKLICEIGFFPNISKVVNDGISVNLVCCKKACETDGSCPQTQAKSFNAGQDPTWNDFTTVMYELYNQLKNLPTDSLDQRVKTDLTKTLDDIKKAGGTKLLSTNIFRRRRQLTINNTCTTIQENLKDISKEIINLQNVISNLIRSITYHYEQGEFYRAIALESIGDSKLTYEVMATSYNDIVCLTTGTLNVAKTKLEILQKNYNKLNEDLVRQCSAVCGTFVPYNSSSNSFEVNGFVGGSSWRDGSYQYVAYGNNDNCEQNPTPGWITNTSISAHMSCHNSSFDSETAFYLLNHPLLSWVKTNVDTMLTVPGAVWVNNSLIGRGFTNGSYEVSKVLINDGVKGLWMMTQGGETHLTVDFEILVCKDLSQTTAATTTTPSAPITNACLISKNLVGSNSEYLKTGCLITLNKTPLNAASYCSSIGMRLMTLSTTDELNAAQIWADRIIGSANDLGIIVASNETINQTCWMFSKMEGGITKPTLTNCDVARWFICEFIDMALTTTTTTTTESTTTTTTTTPTTTTTTTESTTTTTLSTTTTTLAPSISNCKYFALVPNIYGGMSKKLCVIGELTSYSTADAKCRSFGFNGLYQLTKELDSTAIKNFESVYPELITNSSGIFFYVSGQKSSAGNWFNDLFSGVVPYELPTIGSGNCMGFGVINGTIKLSALNCDLQAYPTCEFDVLPPPVSTTTETPITMSTVSSTESTTTMSTIASTESTTSSSQNMTTAAPQESTTSSSQAVTSSIATSAPQESTTSSSQTVSSSGSTTASTESTTSSSQVITDPVPTSAPQESTTNSSQTITSSSSSSVTESTISSSHVITDPVPTSASTESTTSSSQTITSSVVTSAPQESTTSSSQAVTSSGSTTASTESTTSSSQTVSSSSTSESTTSSSPVQTSASQESTTSSSQTITSSSSSSVTESTISSSQAVTSPVPTSVPQESTTSSSQTNTSSIATSPPQESTTISISNVTDIISTTFTTSMGTTVSSSDKPKCDICGIIDWIKFLHCDPQFVTPTNPRPCEISIVPGECLRANRKVYSCNNAFYIQLSLDGNLIVYANNSVEVWSTQTAGRNVTQACMKTDGNFVLLTENNEMIFSTNTFNNSGAYVEVQVDGQLTVKYLGRPIYTSANQTGPLQYACGYQLPLNVNYNPNNPQTPGFDSGLYIDGSKVFPGTGVFQSAAGIRPARISTSLSGAGAYSSHDGILVELFDGISPKYYLPHSNMKWVQTDNANAGIVLGALSVVNSANNTLIVSRFNFTLENVTYQQIGVFWRDLGLSFYWNGMTLFRNTGPFEVLSCGP